MSLLPYLISVTSSDRNNTAKAVNGLVSIIFLVLLALAVFLAIRNMGSLQGTATKIWLFLFAVFVPEVYVVIHGLSNASMGLGFFSESLVDVPSLGSMFGAKASELSAGGDHTPTSMFAAEIKKAAQNVKASVDKTMSSASDTSISGAGSTIGSLLSK
jgi:hypothetical protein